MLAIKTARRDAGDNSLRVFIGDAGAVRRTRPTQAEFNAMIRQRKGEIARALARLKSRSITVDEFGRLMDSVMLEAHANGWMLGRQRAGNLKEEMFDDYLAAVAAKDKDGSYLLRFLDEIDGGRYGHVDDLSTDAIQSRANLYIARARGTANEAFVETSPDGMEFTWHLGGTENHCSDCPEIAALSPFIKDTMFTYPGHGDTPCLSHCKCFLTREDKVSAFQRS